MIIAMKICKITTVLPLLFVVATIHRNTCINAIYICIYIYKYIYDSLHVTVIIVVMTWFAKGLHTNLPHLCGHDFSTEPIGFCSRLAHGTGMRSVPGGLLVQPYTNSP